MNAALPNLARSEFPVLFILSLALGGLIGTRLDIAGRIERLNARFSTRQGTSRNGLHGLVTGCLLYCIGLLPRVLRVSFQSL